MQVATYSNQATIESHSLVVVWLALSGYECKIGLGTKTGTLQVGMH